MSATELTDNAELRARVGELLQKVKGRVEKATSVPHLYRNDSLAIRTLLLGSSADPENSWARQLARVNFTKLNDLSTVAKELTEWRRVHEQCLGLVEFCNKRLRTSQTLCAQVKSDLIDYLLLPLCALINRAVDRTTSIIGV